MNGMTFLCRDIEKFENFLTTLCTHSLSSETFGQVNNMLLTLDLIKSTKSDILYSI